LGSAVAANTLVEKRLLIAHRITREDADYCTFALSAPAIRRVRQATKTGTGILSSISQPFHLDFARNRVLASYDAALLTPCFDMPHDSGTDDLRKFLMQRGVRNVIWKRAGFSVTKAELFVNFLSHPVPLYRSLAGQALRFRGALTRLTANSEVRHLYTPKKGRINYQGRKCSTCAQHSRCPAGRVRPSPACLLILRYSR
jgi:hypothetical protein